MKRPILVVGSGGHCRAILALLMSTGQWNPVGIIDLNFSDAAESILGVSVLGGTEMLETPGDVKTVVLAIGDNQARKEWFEKMQEKGWELPNVVSPDAIVTQGCVMNGGNVIMPRTFIGPEVVLGSNNLVNTGAILEHECSVGSHNHLAPGTIVCGRVSLGDKIFLGAGSVVRDSKSIDGQVIIGAGATVIHSIHESGIFVGTPARRNEG